MFQINYSSMAMIPGICQDYSDSCLHLPGLDQDGIYSYFENRQYSKN